jgi:hypothetical protein
MTFANLSIVIPREGGVSSTPSRQCFISAVAITGPSAFADDDNSKKI